ncbi:hypothetical protein DEM27_05855 [Metarhizobium album]|uniref:Uncharacterized protein n=2 Tax=Metarhizobium album TaxID=2182425 RepID=A0A2U2DV18_9HYPH|nr:hypothetical protein DEM27_05855 [Rhizobium album]
MTRVALMFDEHSVTDDEVTELFNTPHKFHQDLTMARHVTGAAHAVAEATYQRLIEEARAIWGDDAAAQLADKFQMATPAKK